MIEHKKETENLLLSITKSCETLIKQTHTKPQETLEFKLNKGRKTFPFKSTINLGLDFNCIAGSTSLEVFNLIFNNTRDKDKFGLYTDTFNELSFSELKDELEEIPIFPDITASHQQKKYYVCVLLKHVTI